MTQAAPSTLEKLSTADLVGSDTYSQGGYPHAAWTLLRREAPVSYWDEGIDIPFWAITKHADITLISRQPRRFLNEPRLAVFPEIEIGEDGPPARHLLNMDPPDHASYRRLAAPYFTPRAIRRLEDKIDKIASDLLDELARDGAESEMDFVESFSAPLTLGVLAELLGVPRSDWRLMFEWTNQIIGSTDPEYQQGANAEETSDRARKALFEYFAKMGKERLENPRDDIVSVLLHSKLGDGPIPPFELLSYFFLLVVAGNETTRNAISGGLLAMLEHPDQWEKLRRDPGLVEPATEEIVRWTTPVIQFCRTATEDFELRGKQIRTGESMCLFYPSANRDEEVFEDPFAFRVDRRPNPHLAFGIGEHFCLGASLARLELRIAYRQLAERLEHVELTAAPERLRSSFVGGVKHVPLRYRLKPSGA